MEAWCCFHQGNCSETGVKPDRQSGIQRKLQNHANKNRINKEENELLIRYSWKDKAWHSITITAENIPLPMKPDTEFEFITEHYFGFTKREDQTSEYEVCHPEGEYYEVKSHHLIINFETLYGKDFKCLNQQQPVSVMPAEGSEIQVKMKRYLQR